LRTVDTMGGPPKSGTARGVDLAAMDDITRAAIDECGARVDRTQVLAAWEEALSAAAWTAPPVWLHGDLQSGNLLVRDGRLSGVIDFGGLGLGDPAVDLMPAWELLDGPARATFAAAVGCVPDTWARPGLGAAHRAHRPAVPLADRPGVRGAVPAQDRPGAGRRPPHGSCEG